MARLVDGRKEVKGNDKTIRRFDLQLKGEIEEPITGGSRQLCPNSYPHFFATADRRVIPPQSSHNTPINDGATNLRPAGHLQELTGAFSVPRDRLACATALSPSKFVFEAGLRSDQQTRQTKMILRFWPKPRRTL
jgi:hypothetical protein